MAASVNTQQDAGSDAARHGSTEMNATAASSAMEKAGGLRVVFIGNSITLHGPLAAINWFNRWGMAASAAEKDYVHLVIKGLEERTGKPMDARVYNLADFERHFDEYDFGNIQEAVDFNPDYLVIALGENVPNLKDEPEKQLLFREKFKKLLSLFMRGRSKPNTVVRGVFWPSPWKDAAMAHAASDFALPFVRCDFGDDDPVWRAEGLFEHEGVQKHPGDKGMAEIARRVLEGFFPTDSGFAAWMNGEPVQVRPIRLSAMPFNQWAADYQRPVDQTEIGGLVNVEAEGTAEFRVRPARSFKTAKVRPLSAGVVPRVEQGDVVFTVPKPGYYVLELDGYHQPLEIFVNPKRDFEKERREANIVFGPGIHQPVVVKLKSHDRVFIDRDAFVLGSFQVDAAEDVRVSGYGMICGSRNRRVGHQCYRDGMDGAVRIIDSKNVVFDGPTVLDSACWCVAAFNSSHLEFSHVKVTAAWRYNTDGIDICNSQHVHIHDCYVHSFDDAIVLKGISHEFDRKDPIEDIHVERCVCWCGWGRTLETGYETWAPYFRSILFENCDLIHNNHGALSVHLGGPAPVQDITYRNIRLEYDASEMESIVHSEGRDQKVQCKAPWSGEWLTVTNRKMFAPDTIYTNLAHDVSAEPWGTVESVTLEHISITVDDGAMTPGVVIQAESGTSFAGKIHATDIRLNGTDITASVR